MNDFKRVFIHELGHFVAHELNQMYYGGTGTKSITIEHAEYPGLFVGNTAINISADGKENVAPTREHMAHVLVAVIYGCVFQSYLLETRVITCVNVNGGIDKSQRWHTLFNHGIDHVDHILYKIDEAFLEELKRARELDAFIRLDPNNFCVPKNGLWEVDLPHLRESTKPLLIAHSDTYRQLVVLYENFFAENIDIQERQT